MAEITVFGDADPRALEQIERCAAAEDGALGVLCADNHVGYSQPIGGAVAYESHISVSGVGFDIGCIALGSRVSTADGAAIPIEAVRAEDPALCWDGHRVRTIEPHFGAVAQGAREVVRLRLENGRELSLTPDHEVMTPFGWIPAGRLGVDDCVACTTQVGLPADAAPRELRIPRPTRASALSERGWRPVRPDDPRFPALLRLLAYNCGDGSLSTDGKRISFWTTVPEDVGSVALHSLLVALGAPVGRKQWPAAPMRWIFGLPDRLRAQFLSAFLSAEGTTPALVENRIQPVAVNCHAARKRVAAARVTSVAWQHQAQLGQRDALRAEARLLRSQRAHWHAIGDLAERFRVPYGDRGSVRRPRGSTYEPTVDGEVAWVPVVSVEPDGIRGVYDVVTDDPAGSFIAEGIVVHNCGNKGVRTPLQASDIDVPRVMDEIARRISFGVGRANDEPVDHPVLDKIAQADFAPQRKMIQAAREQLGTVGGGNHYVDLFEDEDDGRLWIGVHFGSRGFGHKTASGFLALAAGRRFDERVGEAGMDAPPVLLDVDSELGQAYIAAMNLALDYAYAGRDVVVDTVLDILGTTAEHEVHNNHNYAALEEHFGRRLWVVRKGCTPAFPGQEGFVGGSMGGLSVILAGRESERSAAGLYSTVHGAGRVMSRRQAAGKVKRRKQLVCSVCGEPIEGRRCPRHPSAKPRKTFVREQVTPGAIDWPGVRAELAARGIELRGGAADEAPGVYKQLEQVIAAHGDTIEVRHRLRPIGVAMAGAHVVDPYND